jgi:hypothetical protein
MDSKTQNINKEQFFNMVSLLEHEHEEILISLAELEHLVWDITKIEIDYARYGEIKELTSKIFKRLVFNFRMEEDILFPDLLEVLPKQSSIAAMRVEHSEILELSNCIIEMLLTRELMDKNKEKVEAEIITLIDLIERAFHKKEHVMYHEAESMLSEKQLEELYTKMLKKYSTSPS